MTKQEVKKLRFENYQEAEKMRDALNEETGKEWVALYDDENEVYLVTD